LKKIILRAGREQSVKRFHPWVFSGAIGKMDAPLAEGEDVKVYSSSGECLGTGHFHNGSIAVRVISFTDDELTDRFWKAKFGQALQLRKAAGLHGNGGTNVYRLVNAEGDGFPGLIADFYNGTIVMQAHTAGMYKIAGRLTGVLKQLLGDNLRAVYDKSLPSLKKFYTDDGSDGYLYGAPGDRIVLEHGNKFIVDWERGQKTGFFTDQRENRELLARYSGDRKVLNMFSYTGGFSVYALRGGASLVHTVDSSARAIELADENIALNFQDSRRNRSFCSEAFDFFSNAGDKYDIIVLDPPAFAKNRKSANNALQAYKRLNAKAMEYISEGGLLFTFSCSQVIGADEFRQAVYSAAIQSGREIRILHRLSQPADHPVSIYHPEGEYLKGLVLQLS
jgi:23S rRNA (cytosine1962-C5)-methyltransferase